MCRPVVVMDKAPAADETAIRNLLNRRTAQGLPMEKPNVAIGVIGDRRVIAVNHDEVANRLADQRLAGWRGKFGNDVGQNRVRIFYPYPHNMSDEEIMEIFSRVGDGEVAFYVV